MLVNDMVKQISVFHIGWRDPEWMRTAREFIHPASEVVIEMPPWMFSYDWVKSICNVSKVGLEGVSYGHKGAYIEQIEMTGLEIDMVMDSNNNRFENVSKTLNHLFKIVNLKLLFNQKKPVRLEAGFYSKKEYDDLSVLSLKENNLSKELCETFYLGNRDKSLELFKKVTEAVSDVAEFRDNVIRNNMDNDAVVILGRQHSIADKKDILDIDKNNVENYLDRSLENMDNCLLCSACGTALYNIIPIYYPIQKFSAKMRQILDPLKHEDYQQIWDRLKINGEARGFQDGSGRNYTPDELMKFTGDVVLEYAEGKAIVQKPVFTPNPKFKADYDRFRSWNSYPVESEV